MKLGHKQKFGGRYAVLIRQTATSRRWRWLDGSGDFTTRITPEYKQSRVKTTTVYLTRTDIHRLGIQNGLSYDEIRELIDERA